MDGRSARTSVLGDQPVAGNKSESERRVLHESFDSLTHITMQLRITGMLVPVLTVVNILLPVAPVSFRSIGHPSYPFAFMSIFVTLAVLVLLVRFESMRKRGDALFDEISDEVQWDIRSDNASEKPVPRKRPRMDVRIRLRTFVRSTDLALVPGKYGPAAFAAVNILATIITALLANR